MAAETAIAAQRPAGQRPAGHRRAAGVLSDGTAFYAPIGEVVVDGSRVVCHLCGRSLRSVAAHLTAHGWTKAQYCEAFGLERRQSLEGPETRKLRAAALTARLVFDPAIREGSAAGRDRARSGDLARDAAAAARGRPFPPQRRAKAARAFALVPPAVVARANRERADQHLAEVAAAAARRLGYPDLTAFVRDRLRAGASLAAMSREAGLDKDWLSRHLRRLDPAAAADAAAAAGRRHDALWEPALRRLSVPDVASYLRDRHVAGHWTVNAIAAEAGLSYHAVESALRRHGLSRTAHAAKRHAARERAGLVAAGLGFDSIAAYLAARRGAGWTWRAIAAESGQPPTWLRRRAAEG
jgi:lambda repressor-like predicted transcriptional regulator